MNDILAAIRANGGRLHLTPEARDAERTVVEALGRVRASGAKETTD